MARTVDEILRRNLTLSQLTARNDKLASYFMSLMHQVTDFAKKKGCPIEKVRFEGLKQKEDGTFHMVIRYVK